MPRLATRREPGCVGVHKTYQVTFAPPTIPALANTSLVPGVDGQAYPGDRLTGIGGVPSSPNTCVMPIFFPKMPGIGSPFT